MTLVLNEEQVMLQQSARDFLKNQAPVQHLRTLRDQASETGFSKEIWQQMADMGWPAIIVPESYGGLEFGFTGLGVILQEIGRTLTPCPLLSSSMISLAALLKAGSEQQKEALLGSMASGEHLVSLAAEEGLLHDPYTVSSTATPNADGFSLSGKKSFVIDGMSADSFIVSAQTPVDGTDSTAIALFLVPSVSKGVEIQKRRILDTHVMADVEFKAVTLPLEAMLGTAQSGIETLDYMLDIGLIGQSAELLGIAIEAFARTLEYLKERKQFGVPIGSFQALQHRAADLFSEIEMCKSLVLNALHQLDTKSDLDGPPLSEIASMTKAKLAEVTTTVTAEAIQMHGGIGMTDEFEIGFFYKRAKILSTIMGDQHYHLDRYARLRGI